MLMKKLRGYFGIGILNNKTKFNIGTLYRSAFIFGASFIYTIGRRYTGQHSDYLLGAEDSGISKNILAKCQYVLKIPGDYCLNVATAGSIIMYDRIVKSNNNAKSC